MQERHAPAAVPSSEDELAQFSWDTFLPEKQADERKYSLSIIAPNTTITGKYVTKRAFIYGAVEGLVFAEEVTVEKGGNVRGIVFCKILDIGGDIEADIVCDSAMIREGGLLRGNLKYNWLRIVPGGKILGSLTLRHPRR